MKTRRFAAPIAIAALLVLAACAEVPSDEHEINEPVTLTPIEGTDVLAVTLTRGAADRLEIETAPVEETETGTVVPSAALLVDPEGVFWVYTSPEPLVFIRQAVSVDREEGGLAFLSEGPPVGSEVATVGVAELYGAEYEVGH